MLALGLVETKGLLAAIEGADAMLKAADVRLLEKSLASGGLVTITIAGEVSAVAASVNAAVAAIGRISGSVLVSHHVIARPDAELENIIKLTPNDASCGCFTTSGNVSAKAAASAESSAPKGAPAVQGKSSSVQAKNDSRAESAGSVKAEPASAKPAPVGNTPAAGSKPEAKPAEERASASAAKAQPKAAPKARSKSGDKKSSKKK